MTITESEFRRRLAAALTGTGLALFAEQGLAVSAVLAEARAAGLELAPEPPRLLEMRVSIAGEPYLAPKDGMWRGVAEKGEDLAEAARRNNAFPALDARAARLAAALGELLAIAEAQGGLEAERLRRAVAEGRAALAEGGEP